MSSEFQAQIFKSWKIESYHHYCEHQQPQKALIILTEYTDDRESIAYTVYEGIPSSFKASTRAQSTELAIIKK